MGTAILVGAGVFALMVAGFLVYGLYLGALGLARASGQAYRWLVTPRPNGEPSAEGSPAIKCWELRRCSSEARGNCPAYRNKAVPCWQAWIEASTPRRVKADCLGCTLFSLPQMVAEA
ncbi:MAG: hypothetical protein HW414_315 [Dehalococcoidia bacterium]|nr:hypothetical protein [Dehalococcoidia bacterium]